MYDWERYEVVPEVLLSDGVRFPSGNQVPLLDSHYPRDVKNQLGSVRNLSRGDRVVTGTLSFASVAGDAWAMVREGHTTDVSVGYQVLKRQYIADGQTKIIKGREFIGPVNVVTQWRLLEVSLTPIGADDQAKLRGLDPSVMYQAVRDIDGEDSEDFVMREELRQLLESLGMPKALDDDAAQRWLVDNRDKLAERKSTAVGSDGADATGTLTPEAVRKMIADAVTSAVKDAEGQRSAAQERHRKDVDLLLDVAGLGAPDLKSRCYAATDIEAVRQIIVDERAKHQPSVGVAPVFSYGPAQKDKHQAAVRTALLMQTFASCIPGHDDEGAESRRSRAIERLFPSEQRAKDYGQFRHASLYDLACECLRMDGVDVRGLSRESVAMVALGFGDQIGVRSEAAYHVTGSFPYIVQDAINKSMMLGYGEYPATWRGPMRQGESVPDFKTIHRMQLGAIPNLPVWNDSFDPTQVSTRDEEETYAVECRSSSITFSYKLLVNDDRSAIARLPFRFGDSAARTVNAVAWAQVTGNPTMRDGQALFLTSPTGNRKRSNQTAGSVSDYTAAIQTMTDKMMQMRGSNTPEEAEGPDILGLSPRYWVSPSALRTKMLQNILSISDPASSNSGVVNINNNLIPIVEPLLDASSTTAFYLFAEPTRVETVEVTFLQGQESPLVRTVLDPKKLSQEHIVLQTFAAKALDHRGIQRHAGA